MEYYSAIKTNELLIDATTWMNLKHGVKEARHDRTHPIWFHLQEALDLVKLINCNRNLTYIMDELRRNLFWVSWLSAEMQWIINILCVYLSRQPTTTEIPSLPIHHQVVQERTFMSTTRSSVLDQGLESKPIIGECKW